MSLMGLESNKIVQVLVLCLTFAAGGFSGYKYAQYKMSTQKEVPQGRPATVEAARAIQEKLSSRIKVAGLLKANESIVLRNEVEGKINKIFYEGGSYVEKDAVLLTLDDAIYKAQLEEARAQLVATEAQYKRLDELAKKGYATKKDFDKGLSDYETAVARFDLAKTKLAQTVIRAPFEGFLGLRDVSPGAVLKPGQDLMSLEDLDPLRVEFKVPESEAQRVTLHQKIEIYVGNDESEHHEAMVDAIDSKVDPVGHNLTIRATLHNQNGHLKSGQFANVYVPVGGEKEVITVPEAAVESVGKTEHVFIVEDNVARKVEVKTGRREKGKVEIINGVKKGDLVVTAGHLKIGNGSEVTVVSN